MYCLILNTWQSTVYVWFLLFALVVFLFSSVFCIYVMFWLVFDISDLMDVCMLCDYLFNHLVLLSCVTCHYLSNQRIDFTESPLTKWLPWLTETPQFQYSAYLQRHNLQDGHRRHQDVLLVSKPRHQQGMNECIEKIVFQTTHVNNFYEKLKKFVEGRAW